MQQVTNNEKDENKVINNVPAANSGTAAATSTPAVNPAVVPDEKNDEDESDTKFESQPEEEVTVYGVYTKAGLLVRKLNVVNHGKDFIKIATAYAEKNGMVAKPYIAPLTPEESEKDVVHIVTSNNQPVRSFSLAVHGKKYQELAKQFVEKYSIRKGYKVKK